MDIRGWERLNITDILASKFVSLILIKGKSEVRSLLCTYTATSVGISLSSYMYVWEGVTCYRCFNIV